MGSKKVICQDARIFINESKEFDSVVTSLPDAEETNMTSTEWEKWFVEIVRDIILKTKNYAVFYQTDRKTDGKLIDKSFLLNKGNELAKGNCLFNKVALRIDVGKKDLFRPSFTHLLCFSKNKKSGKCFEDVFERGKMIYNNAMGLTACKKAIEYIKTNSDTKEITDPFCGRGSILAVSNKMGLDAVGCDILEEQCEHSRKISIK